MNCVAMALGFLCARVRVRVLLWLLRLKPPPALPLVCGCQRLIGVSNVSQTWSEPSSARYQRDCTFGDDNNAIQSVWLDFSPFKRQIVG